MKITLYLMTLKGYKVLMSLIDNGFRSMISEVIIGEDKNIDNDYANEMHALCKKSGINCFDRNDKCCISSNYSIAISWRWLIPSNNSRLIVLHDSILPRYRGFAPLVNMLINKEEEIGVSAIFASEEYDKGEIIAQSSTKISYPITISQAIDLISNNYNELVIEIFNTLAKGNELKSVPQNEDLASYSLWRNEDDLLINWQQDSTDILNFINSVSRPYKGAATFINGKQKIRILEADIEPDVRIENRDVGKVIFLKNKYPIIVCGSGLLKLKRVVNDNTKEDMLPFKNFRIRLSDLKNEQP